MGAESLPFYDALVYEIEHSMAAKTLAGVVGGLAAATAGAATLSVFAIAPAAAEVMSDWDNDRSVTQAVPGSRPAIEGGSKTVKDLISESDAAKKWGILDDGTNQGVKHFSDYWEKYPERIPSLEQRLGVTEGSFNNSLEGFNNFTSQAEHVVSEATSVGNVRNINGKTIY